MIVVGPSSWSPAAWACSGSAPRRSRQAPATFSLPQALRTTLRNTQFLAFLPTFVLFQVGLAMLIGVCPTTLRRDHGPEKRSRGLDLGADRLGDRGDARRRSPSSAGTPIRRSKRRAYRRAMLLAGLRLPAPLRRRLHPRRAARCRRSWSRWRSVGAPLGRQSTSFPRAGRRHRRRRRARTGMRREAIYFGMQSFVEKTTTPSRR